MGENEKFNDMQMNVINEASKKGFDVTILKDSRYDWRQMSEIYLGMKDKVDVSVYASPLLSYQKMQMIRKTLVSTRDTINGITSGNIEKDPYEDKDLNPVKKIQFKCNHSNKEKYGNDFLLCKKCSRMLSSKAVARRELSNAFDALETAMEQYKILENGTDDSEVDPDVVSLLINLEICKEKIYPKYLAKTGQDEILYLN